MLKHQENIQLIHIYFDILSYEIKISTIQSCHAGFFKSTLFLFLSESTYSRPSG